jgi:hypothetical protein
LLLAHHLLPLPVPLLLPAHLLRQQAGLLPVPAHLFLALPAYLLP